MLSDIFANCVVPENIYTFTTEGIFSEDPTPQEIPIKLPTFL